ncbi:caspase-3-like [Dendronephthya gigantea]|uniref:caspase-3-like n=1 Tax=Dendronephthya gigantea TaxID=151771 RepID=UPI00106CF248|nr:caspase-3-like [Dendronephthya gigantea]
MAGSKFNVNIQGGSGHIFMGDGTQIDIRSGIGRAGSRQRPHINIQPRDPGFAVHPKPQETSVHRQETTGNALPVTYKIQQGFALIIHNHYFPKRQDCNREGSEKDVEAIQKFCEYAGIDVNKTSRSTENLKATEIDSLCDEIAQRDFTRYDGFLCFILSHGDEDGIFGVDDNTISVQDMVTKFKKCLTLVGKPKLFFIQACRGSHKDSGMFIDSDSHPVNKPNPLRLPTDSDILIAHSTVEGLESYRCRKTGSWFIITLMQQLEMHAHHMHLMDILTLVNNLMAGFETDNDLKQMSCQMTTLTKFVYFHYPAPIPSPP